MPTERTEFVSDTTADTPKPAIIAASTQNDVIRTIANDPDLRSAVLAAFTGLMSGDKSLLGTRTFWAALITPIVGALAARYAVGLDGATVGAIATVLTSGAMIVMRTVTQAPVTSVLPKGTTT